MKHIPLVLAGLALSLPLFAQDDSGASLQIRFVNDQPRFHVGEVIGLELSFSAATPDAYDIETRNYDRSGRLTIEGFHVTPPGRDPLERYYSLGGFIMGGLGGQRQLSSKPYVIRDDLNEWVALDNPGHYSVYVTSGRVTRHGTIKDEPIELRSNSLEFDVVAADSAWQQQTVSWAVTTLGMESSTAEEKHSALRTLRFLDSPDSVRQLVRQMARGSSFAEWDALAGLAGSRQQDLVVSELESEMAAPDSALSGNYLYILGKLKFQLEHDPLPPYPKDEAHQKTWNDQRQKAEQDYNVLQDGLYEKAATLVLTKQGNARAETVATVLLRPERQIGGVPPLADLPAGVVISSFLNLSLDEQWNLLLSFWGRLRVPEMAEPLKKIAQLPNMSHQMLRDAALRRLVELDPDQARPVFYEEITHPHIDNNMYTVKGETLGLLPDKTLPQFDQLLAARLEDKDSRTRDLDTQLVGRYSTIDILPRVKAVYASSPGCWDCVSEDGFVLYFLRVDPDYGVKRLAVAPSSCMTNSLKAVTRMHRWADVEPGVIDQLNGPDLNRGRQAAETLAQYGSVDAEKAMWERLRKFHDQWADRANELIDRPGMKRDANEAMSFEFGLVEAMSRAQAWLLSNEEITKLEDMTVGPERDNVKQWHWSSPVDMNVSFSWDGVQAFINSQYFATDIISIQNKLAQYPSGTAFRLTISGPADAVAAARKAIDDAAAAHALTIESRGPQP
jgi:hypothetical protein